MPTNGLLWTRLQTFEIDLPGDAMSFSDRLRRENGWTRRFALEAINEYRKFVYLAVASPAPVTPSDIVDQVWHLHLTYTRSYWDDMCGGVLQRPLHHGPTKGGRCEDRKYRSQYAYTLEQYRLEFESEPPARFWPDEGERFASGLHQQWVDRRTHFTLPRATVRRGSAILAAVAGTIALTGSAMAADLGIDPKLVEVLLPFALALFVVVLLMVVFSGRRRRSGKSRAGDSSAGIFFGCSGSGSGKNGSGGDGDGGGSGCGGGGCGGD